MDDLDSSQYDHADDMLDLEAIMVAGVLMAGALTALLVGVYLVASNNLL